MNVVQSVAEKEINFRRAKTRNLGYILYKQRFLLLMLLPTLIVITVFAYKPIIGWILAFKDYQIGKSIFAGEWIGFEAFKEFFYDSSDAFYIFRNTIVINIGCLILNLIGAAVFAVLLNEVGFKSGKSLVQTLSIFPFFISWVIVYALFNVFFSANTGLINVLLVNIGILDQGINVLGDPAYSWLMMLGVNLWKSLGYNSVIFLATIAGIDQEQYESADIDGAGRFAKIFFITLPSIMGTFAVLMVLNSGWLLNSNFEQFFLFTTPTNLPTMEVFDMYVYRFGMKLARFSYATAVCILKTGVSLIMLAIVNYSTKKLVGKSVL